MVTEELSTLLAPLSPDALAVQTTVTWGAVSTPASFGVSSAEGALISTTGASTSSSAAPAAPASETSPEPERPAEPLCPERPLELPPDEVSMKPPWSLLFPHATTTSRTANNAKYFMSPIVLN